MWGKELWESLQISSPPPTNNPSPPSTNNPSKGQGAQDNKSNNQGEATIPDNDIIDPRTEAKTRPPHLDHQADILTSDNDLEPELGLQFPLGDPIVGSAVQDLDISLSSPTTEPSYLLLQTNPTQPYYPVQPSNQQKTTSNEPNIPTNTTSTSQPLQFQPSKIETNSYTISTTSTPTTSGIPTTQPQSSPTSSNTQPTPIIATTISDSRSSPRYCNGNGSGSRSKFEILDVLKTVLKPWRRTSSQHVGFGWQTPGAWGRSGNHGIQSWYTGMSPFHSSRFRIDYDFHDLVFHKLSLEVAFFKIYHFSLNPILLSQCSLGMYFVRN